MTQLAPESDVLGGPTPHQGRGQWWFWGVVNSAGETFPTRPAQRVRIACITSTQLQQNQKQVNNLMCWKYTSDLLTMDE